MGNNLFAIKNPWADTFARDLVPADVIIEALSWIHGHRPEFIGHFHELSASIHLGKNGDPNILVMFLDAQVAPKNPRHMLILCEGVYQNFLIQRYSIVPSPDHLRAVPINISMDVMFKKSKQVSEAYTPNDQVNILIEQLLLRDKLIESLLKHAQSRGDANAFG